MPSRRQKLSREEINSLFQTYQENNDPEVKRVLVDAYMDLVHSLARRFANRGEPLDDLVQVASMGLLKAIDRFEPDRNVQFTTYAVPTIVGELRRYFRDRASAIRLPRGLRERSHALNAAIQKFSQEHSRSPSVAEIAGEIGLTEEEVIESLESSEAVAVASLDTTTDEGDLSLLDIVGGEDKALEMLDERLSLAGAMSNLDAREQNLLYLRFIEGLSQTEIAERLHISQMHVSRLLRRTLNSLRQNLSGTEMRRPY
ncbi:MAG: SigB/SigF/SigG family RNA polymerase sigma factor [Thermoleophilia bacterium]|nr:SigB/SigF/SigG family RNA polymerase sigma factor [Thermoleophilia bacterium]